MCPQKTHTHIQKDISPPFDPAIILYNLGNVLQDYKIVNPVQCDIYIKIYKEIHVRKKSFCSKIIKIYKLSTMQDLLFTIYIYKNQ